MQVSMEQYFNQPTPHQSSALHMLFEMIIREGCLEKSVADMEPV